MSQVGSGEVVIFPTFKNFRSATVREVDSVGKESSGRFSSAFKGAVAGIATAFSAVKLKDFALDGIKGASELQQSVGAVSAIFKEGAGQMTAWSDTAATAVGLTKNEYNELGSLIGSQLKNGGTAMDELAPKTNQLIGLGADLSSMFGGDTRTAVEALSSALKGERDPIEKYGVSLNQAKIDAEAAALGFEKVGGSLSTEAQQAATLSLIMKQTADAHGNFASEADTLAGKQQRLSAMWENGKTAIMESLIPALSSVTGWFIDKLPAGILFAKDTLQEIVGGIRAFGASWAANEGDITSSGFPGFMERIGFLGRQAFDAISAGWQTVVDGFNNGTGAISASGLEPILAGIGDAVRTVYEAFMTGDMSAFTEFFSGFMAIAQPSGPIIAEVGGAIGAMSSEIGGLVAGALPLLPPLLEGAANVMNFLAENSGILTAAIVAIAAGMLVMKAAQLASNVASVAAVPANLALAASNFASASAARANAAAQLATVGATTASTTAEKASLATKLASVGASVRQAAAFVASRAVLIGGAIATGVATAAQWAFNAAMSANPVMLVVLAIAALVAGLVWFFTQTELGQQVWANFTQFLSEAWTNISAVFSTVWNGIVEVFTNVWNTIVSVFNVVWQAIVFVVTLYINIVLTIITSVVNFIVGVWTTVWNGIVAVFTFVWSAIVLYVTTYINVVRTIITAVVTTISNVWNSLWSGISSFFAGIWKGIVAAVSSFGTFFQNAFRGIAGFVTTAFNGVLSAVRGPINGIIGLVNSAIDSLNGLRVTIPAWVPLVGGQTWGLSLPKIPRLAAGGIVSSRPGGGLYNLGEGKYDEAVVPLDQKFYDALEGGGRQTQIKVEVVNKTGGVALGDLIELYIEQAGVRRRVALENGSRVN